MRNTSDANQNTSTQNARNSSFQIGNTMNITRTPIGRAANSTAYAPATAAMQPEAPTEGIAICAFAETNSRSPHRPPMK